MLPLASYPDRLAGGKSRAISTLTSQVGMERRERDKMTGINMSENRWDNLDFEPPSRVRSDGVQRGLDDRRLGKLESAGAPDSPRDTTAEVEPVAPEVTQACAVYVLR